MPTFDVETNIVDRALQRRLARRLSTWIARDGTPLSHTIVKYRHLEPARVFSGPMPFDQPPDRPANLAFVACHVSHARSFAFRMRLARFIVEALQPDIAPERIFVEIRPVDPRDHVIGDRIPEEV